MAEIGRINKLTIINKRGDGAYLDGGASGEIFLPKKVVPGQCRPGDQVEVFVYVDREKQLRATTKKPHATVGQVARLRVAAIAPSGAWLDWGLENDLFVPKREQRAPMEKGKAYVVFLFLDEITGRVNASSILDQFLGLESPDYARGDEVDLFICAETDLGYKTVVNNSHLGMVYKNEVFQTLHTGQQLKGYIKLIRADLKIDISLQRPGYQGVDTVLNKILKIIADHGGSIAVSDKSPPEEIYALFGVSKKTFKKAIGALYKRRLITIDAKGIRLVQKNRQRRR